MFADAELCPFGPNLDGYHDPSVDLELHVRRRTLEALDDARRTLPIPTTADELHTLQDRIRQRVTDGIGGLVEDSRIERAERSGTIPGPGYTVEKLALTTTAGVRIPCNLYLPDATPPPGGRPAVVLLCGHYEHSKAHDDYQRAAGAFASAGYVVAVFDPNGQGERSSYDTIPAGTAQHTYAGLQCWWWGTSPARYFVDDARRVVDLLESRPDVDASRIVAVGSSGGGMLTTLLMALEPRLAGAAPATFVTSKEAYLATGGTQDAEQILFGGASLDHDRLLMAMAPRPVLVLAAQSDFFPIEGTIASVDSARAAWRIHDADAALGLEVTDCAHRLHPRMADLAVDFFNRHLHHDGEGIPASEIPVMPPESLACGVGEAGADIHDRLMAEVSVAGGDVAAWLRERVEHGREPQPLQVRTLGARRLWQSEPGIWNCAITTGDTVERIHLTDDGTLAPPALEGGPPSLVLDVRGRGALAPRERNAAPSVHHAFATYRIMSGLLELGDSLAAGQVWDVLRAIDHFAPDGVTLVGTGYGAYLARLVALLRPVELELDDEFVRPASTARLWDEGRGGWHGIIPGLARCWPDED